MNVDGSEKKKILDISPTIYFYQDGYTFLYVDETKIYKTNIDGSINEYIFDVQQTPNQNLTIQGFDPIPEEFLVMLSTFDSVSALGKYSVRTRSLSVLLTAEVGYTIFQAEYSKDCSKIAFVEHSINDEYLSILDNGLRRRLVQIPTNSPPVSFSFIPAQFSYDGKYIAFSKQVFNSGPGISWKNELYAVNISTGTFDSIDVGHSPSWNPK
jgi:hypothetical protein